MKLKPGVSIQKWTQHIFHQNQETIQRILYEISFFISSKKTILELDQIYSRCAGSLPKQQRDEIKLSILAVQEVNSFEKFWISLGMEGILQEDCMVHIEAYFTHLTQSFEKWRKGKTSSISIQVPSLAQGVSIAALGIVQFNSEQEKLRLQLLAEERKKHRGYPPLNSRRKLDPTVCNYCGKQFKCRDHLFRHLRKMIEPERMINNWHKIHIDLKVKNDNSLTCEACGKTFETLKDIHDHYAAMVLFFLFSTF